MLKDKQILEELTNETDYRSVKKLFLTSCTFVGCQVHDNDSLLNVIVNQILFVILIWLPRI